jgi:hypothetical protein
MPSEPPSGRAVLAGLGALLLVAVCCAALALIAAGRLSLAGAWASSSWLLGTLAVIALAAGALGWRHRHRRR